LNFGQLAASPQDDSEVSTASKCILISITLSFITNSILSARLFSQYLSRKGGYIYEQCLRRNGMVSNFVFSRWIMNNGTSKIVKEKEKCKK